MSFCLSRNLLTKPCASTLSLSACVMCFVNAFYSLSEQLHENEQLQHPDDGGYDAYSYGPTTVKTSRLSIACHFHGVLLTQITADDAEFFEQLEREERAKGREQALQEEWELQQFRRQAFRLDQKPKVVLDVDGSATNEVQSLPKPAQPVAASLKFRSTAKLCAFPFLSVALCYNVGFM